MLVGRRAFLDNEKSADDTAVASRQQGERKLAEEKPDAEHAGEDDGRGEPAVVEKPIERAPVKVANRVEEPRYETLRPVLAMAGAAFDQNARAHQRRERQRDETGGENRDDDGNGELAKNSPEQSGHESKRNKNRRERKRHGENGERNFARAVHRRLIDRLARFRAADDVFQKDDGVIDEEADGECQRHQGKIIDGITEPHIATKVIRNDIGSATTGMSVSAGASEENEDDENDENESDARA